MFHSHKVTPAPPSAQNPAHCPGRNPAAAGVAPGSQWCSTWLASSSLAIPSRAVFPPRPELSALIRVSTAKLAAEVGRPAGLVAAGAVAGAVAGADGGGAAGDSCTACCGPLPYVSPRNRWIKPRNRMYEYMNIYIYILYIADSDASSA
jgi:hypothetical protein